MTHTNITALRKNLFGFVEQVVTYGEVVNVTTRSGNAVILSEQDYNSLLETLHLTSIPGMTESLKAAADEPLEDCVPYDPEEAW